MRAAPLAIALAAHVAAADPREAAHSHRGDFVARAVIEKACAELAPARAALGAVADSLANVRAGASASERYVLLDAAIGHREAVGAPPSGRSTTTRPAPRAACSTPFTCSRGATGAPC